METAIIVMPRIVIGAVGLVLGGVCALMAWENGRAYAPGFDGQLYALAFASGTVASWFLLPIAKSTDWATALFQRLLFVGGTAFVLVNSIGLAAKHRDQGVGAKSTIISTYDQAQRDLARLESELETMKPNPRWKTTSGCADVTVPKSDAFCQTVKATQRSLDEARKTLAAGRPLSADPQAERIGHLIGWTPEQVGESLPTFLAIILDLLASGCMAAAFAPIKRPAAMPLPATQLDDTDPVWLASASSPAATVQRVFPPYGRSVPFGRMDGRALRWLPKRAANMNAA